jgi:hypothetical protein
MPLINSITLRQLPVLSTCRGGDDAGLNARIHRDVLILIVILMLILILASFAATARMRMSMNREDDF